MSESLRQRSEILGTQVITRNTGKRLGVVSQIWVDIDRREVIGFGVKDSILALSAMPRYMGLDSISQIGDVLLVEDDRAIEDYIEADAYNTLIGNEVITETGELLGKVRGFKFDVEDGKLDSIVIASIALPQIPEQILSTYELPIDEVVSSGPDRLIVFEGAEARLVQLSVGILERLGISSPPWERDEEDIYYQPAVAPGNQLGSGLRTEAPERRQEIAASRRTTEAWDEDEWQDSDRTYARARQEEPAYSDRYETDRYDDQENWSDTPRRREREAYAEYEDSYAIDEDPSRDAWDDEPQPYRAPKLEIPEKVRERELEYEED